MLEIDDSFQKKYKYVLAPQKQDSAAKHKPWFKFSQQNNNNYELYFMLSDEEGVIHKAADNKEYNIKEIFLTRLSILLENLKQTDDKNKSDIEKFFDQVRENLKTGTSQKELEEIIQTTIDNIIQTSDFKHIFELQTGREFLPENIEKFLKGEIELSAEKEYKISTGMSAGKVSSPPFLKSDTVEYQENIGNKKTRKTLNDKEKIMYAKICNAIDKDMQQKLDSCLNSGKLLQYDSKNKTTVLDNLYKILILPRAGKISNIKILNECINILNNPYIITQLTEDIPDTYFGSAAEMVYNEEERRRQARKETAKHSKDMKKQIQLNGEDKLTRKDELIRIKESLLERNVGTCVGASLEFYFASQQPVEFFRFVERLTSKDKEVKKVINFRRTGLTDYEIDLFKTNYDINNGFLELSLSADESAYFLADMQEETQDDDERTTVDILMQSLIFQLASGNTYDSISDRHLSNFTDINGLGDTEEEYVLKILTDENVLNTDYAEYDSDSHITQRTDKKIIEKALDSVITSGKYVLVGIGDIENGNRFTNGHEITITGITDSIDGTKFYICKDTNSEYPRPILIEKEYIFNHIMNSIIVK